MAKCCICKDKLDTEHPAVMHHRNPLTFRHGWMHSYCYMFAIEDLDKVPSKNTQYESRKDEYFTRFA